MSVAGTVTPGFEPVRDAFVAGFRKRGEVGAAVSVYVHGDEVVSLWGGEAQPGVAWDERTIANVFSVSKGATALVAQILADRGLLDLDAPVATYWPEFAAAGKDDVTVEMILTHTAGVPWFDGYAGVVSWDDAQGWGETDEIVRRLAAQAPIWKPGSACGYHSMTYGWLVGELTRRVTGTTLGRFFREAVAEPLGLDFFFGLPESEFDRVAQLRADPNPRAMDDIVGTEPDTPKRKSFFIGPEYRSPHEVAGQPAFWAAEAPAVSGLSDARSIARLYGALSAGGELNGVRLVSTASTERHAAEHIRVAEDAIFGRERRMGYGYALAREHVERFGRSDRSFGAGGLGGALGFADPEAGVGFGYVANQMFVGILHGPDERARALTQALYGCLAEV